MRGMAALRLITKVVTKERIIIKIDNISKNDCDNFIINQPCTADVAHNDISGIFQLSVKSALS